MELAKIPPHDIDAEQAVLGSMLTDKEAVNAAIESLKEDAFYRDDNRIIFQAIVNLYSKSEPSSIISFAVFIKFRNIDFSSTILIYFCTFAVVGTLSGKLAKYS